MKDIISKIIDKISIAKVLIAAGIAVTATTIALAIKALKKRLAAKKVKPVAPIQAIKLSDLDEVTFEDTEEEIVEEEPGDDIIDSEESEDELEELSDMVEDTEVPPIKVEEADPVEMGFGSIVFTNDNTKKDLDAQKSEQKLDDEWYKKTLANIFDDESFLEPEEEYVDPFESEHTPEEIEQARWAVLQCEKLIEKLSSPAYKNSERCHEYAKLVREAMMTQTSLRLNYQIYY